MEDQVVGVFISIEIGPSLAGLVYGESNEVGVGSEIKGSQRGTSVARIEGSKADIGGNACRGVEDMEDKVAGVTVSIEIGLPLVKLRNNEDNEVVIDCRTADKGNRQAGIRCHTGGSIKNMEDTVVGITVSIEIRPALVDL